MKLLFDQNISHRIVHLLEDLIPHAKQVRSLGLENHSDKSIWEFAKIHEYTIVTFDGDFYDFSLVWGHPPKIIWLRSFNQTTQHIEQSLRKYYETIGVFLEDENLACLEIIHSM